RQRDCCKDQYCRHEPFHHVSSPRALSQVAPTSQKETWCPRFASALWTLTWDRLRHLFAKARGNCFFLFTPANFSSVLVTHLRWSSPRTPSSSDGVRLLPRLPLSVSGLATPLRGAEAASPGGGRWVWDSPRPRIRWR